MSDPINLTFFENEDPKFEGVSWMLDLGNDVYIVGRSRERSAAYLHATAPELYDAAVDLINDVMKRYTLRVADDLECPFMRKLAMVCAKACGETTEAD